MNATCPELQLLAIIELAIQKHPAISDISFDTDGSDGELIVMMDGIELTISSKAIKVEESKPA